MSSTEVIGLLGGTFIKDEGVLEVLLAVPCNSISTGMQCEMDPGKIPSSNNHPYLPPQ